MINARPPGNTSTDETTSGRQRRIGFLLVDQFSMIAFATAIEPLRLANRALDAEHYRFQLFADPGPACRASNGVELKIDGTFDEASDLDMMIVCGGLDIQRRDHKRLKAALRRGAARGATIGAVCTGTYVLAKAGLLDGYRATIHWENFAGLASEDSKIDLGADLFEIDRNRMTCAGGIAAADMMLAIVARDHGPAVAAAVADQLIHHRIREAGEDQRMDLRARLDIAHPKLLQVVALMEATLAEPLNSHALAQAVHISPRQLERLFLKYLGRPPSKHYLKLRLERARLLIRQTAMPLLEIALDCGFTSASHFSKAYADGFGRPPSSERKAARAMDDLPERGARITSMRS